MGEIRLCWTVPLDKMVWHEVVPPLLSLAAQGYPYLDIPQQPIDLARNAVGRYVLDSPFTHVVMLDADHKHPRYVLDWLARWPAQDPAKYQVVGGLNFRRAQPFDPCAYVDEGDKVVTVDYRQPGPIKVDRLGTGSILIAREVFERLEYPWFVRDWQQHREQPGEDMYFSLKCGAAGIDLWVDPTVTSPHFRASWVGRDTFEDYLVDTGGLNVPVMSEEQERSWLEECLPGLFRSQAVLYVGADKHRSRHAQTFQRWGAELTLLEPFAPNCRHYFERGAPFRHIVQGNVVTLKRERLSRPRYDVAFWWHGPEHVTREQLPAALANLESVADLVVCGCPWGLFPQPAAYGNPDEEHRSHLDAGDFETHGYTVATFGAKDVPPGSLLAWKKVTL